MGLVDEAEFHYFHFFPYTNLPARPQRLRVALGRLPELQLRPEDSATTSTTGTSSEMVLADKLGYDGLVLNEHHNTAVLR